MPPRIAESLRELYGETHASRVAPQLHSLLEHYRPKVPKPGQALPLNEKDALLITYADQLREPGGKPLGTLARFAEQYLAGIISGIHLLPFYPWSSDDGFSVCDYYAVEPAYGSWTEVAAFGKSFDLMFDGVFNHLSAQSEWFRGFLAGRPEYRDFFVTVDGNPDLADVIRPRTSALLTEFKTAAGVKKVWTTFSADQVDLNFRNPEVLLAIVEVLLFYVAKGARFIRLDAIAFLWKEMGSSCLHLRQTHRVIQLMRAVLNEIAPQVLLITETNVPHRDNLSYFGDGTNEAQLVYNFALPPLVLHSLHTGNAEKLSRWAQSLALPSPRVSFFNFLASHDGIGLNPVRGLLDDAEINRLVSQTLEHGGFVSYKKMPDGSEVPYELNINYLDGLSNPRAGEPVELAARKFLVAQAIMLSLQGMPGIYFHSLVGSRGDRQAAESTGIKRRINREKLEFSRLESDLSDTSSLRWRIFKGYCDLLRLRRANAAFAPTASQHVLELDPRVFSLLRQSGAGERVLCLHNVSNQPVKLSWSQAAIPETASAGSRSGCELPPYGVFWLPFGQST